MKRGKLPRPGPGLRPVTGNYHLIFIFRMYAIFVAITLLSGAVLFIVHKYLEYDLLLSVTISMVLGLGLTIRPVFLMTRKYDRPSQAIKKSLKLMGEGHLDRPLVMEKKEILSDIADSLNIAEQELALKLRALERKTGRIAFVEEQLSAHFKANVPIDGQIGRLIYLLEISTNRLKNELSSFSFDGEQAAQ